MTVYIMRGPSGSGKTTYRKQRFPEATVISRDLIRPMFGIEGKGVLSKEKEKIVTQIEIQLLRDAIRRGEDVVVDNTNLNNNFARRYADEAHLMGVGFLELWLYDPLLNNQYVKRSDIPEDAVRRQCVQAEKMKPLVSRIPKPFTAVEQDESKPPVFIFDIDGTLAHMVPGPDGTVRSPYDYSRVMEDKPDKAVFDAANSLSRWARAIYVSGRSEDCRFETEEWLEKYDAPFAPLYMRKSEDNRPDSVVKREILERDILPNYNVLGVFDDRASVIEMWITSGLKVFDVGQRKADF